MSSRKLGLGIDTGGTYTDAVIIDMTTMEVLKRAKSLTTHHDLAIGLIQSVRNVFADGMSPEEVDLVGISTTLATNSILEGKGGDVGLILIGWEPLKAIDMGETIRANIQGGFDFNGRMVHAISEDEVKDAVRSMEGKVDAIALAGLFSTINASQEKQVRSIIREMTDLPVVAGYELSMDLGIDVRAETAVLNGKLIPVMDRFFRDIEHTFKAMGLTAPIMVAKGDGSIMSMETAKVRPVETILSGPSASAIGGRILSGLDECVIVDIGGTSTDIAILSEGYPQVQSMGATVGRWRTRVRAVDMWTAALGGDSRVWLKNLELGVGPVRVIPLCMVAENWPGIAEQVWRCHDTDLYIPSEKQSPGPPGNIGIILEQIRERGPLTLFEIRNLTEGIWLVEEYLEELVARGLVLKGGLTLTDILHHTGEQELGDKTASTAGVEMLSERMDIEPDEFVSKVKELIHTRITTEIVRKLLEDELGDQPSGALMDRVMDKTTRGDVDSVLSFHSNLDRPIVGVGAPASFIMPEVARRLGAELVLPRDLEVGNAVGAVCSKVTEVVTAKVTHASNYNYVVNIPFMGTLEYMYYESAISSIKRSLERFVVDKVAKEGGIDIEVQYSVKDFIALEGRWGWWDGQVGRQMKNAEVTVRAVGDPVLRGHSSNPGRDD